MRFIYKALCGVSCLLLSVGAPVSSQVLGAAPGAPSLSAPVDDDILNEFKKYFRKYKDTATRVEAILSLDGADSPSVVKVLLPILDDEDAEVVDAAIRILGGLKSRDSIDALFVRLADEKDEATRLGLLRVIAEGGLSGDPEALLECLEDKSWRIRYRGIQALASRKEKSATPTFVELCKDKEPAVRCAAIEALVGFGDELVIDISIDALDDKSWQVRSSAAQGLTKLRAQRSITPLIEHLSVEEGRLQMDYAKALEEITGKYYGLRIQLWQDWWAKIKDRFKIPSDAELKKTKEKRAESAARYNTKTGTSYHGIDTPSRAILFIIDVSGSMENHVIEKERFEDGDYPSMSRIDIVKTELQRTIEGLDSYVEINILAFATKVIPWKKKLVKCNVLNKSSAMDWVGKLEALGGSSKEGLARAGLVGAANLGAGKTNTYGVLMKALEVAGRGARDEAYEIAVDTIFFLSDGRPTAGELVDPDDILREVRVANDLRKVVIHTIAIGEFQKEFMRTMARESNGQFVDLGR